VDSFQKKGSVKTKKDKNQFSEEPTKAGD